MEQKQESESDRTASSDVGETDRTASRDVEEIDWTTSSDVEENDHECIDLISQPATESDQSTVSQTTINEPELEAEERNDQEDRKQAEAEISQDWSIYYHHFKDNDRSLDFRIMIEGYDFDYLRSVDFVMTQPQKVKTYLVKIWSQDVALFNKFIEVEPKLFEACKSSVVPEYHVRYSTRDNQSPGGINEPLISPTPGPSENETNTIVAENLEAAQRLNIFDHQNTRYKILLKYWVNDSVEKLTPEQLHPRHHRELFDYLLKLKLNETPDNPKFKNLMSKSPFCRKLFNNGFYRDNKSRVQLP